MFKHIFCSNQYVFPLFIKTELKYFFKNRIQQSILIVYLLNTVGFLVYVNKFKQFLNLIPEED